MKVSEAIHRKLKILAAQSGLDIQEMADQVITVGIAEWRSQKGRPTK